MLREQRLGLEIFQLETNTSGFRCTKKIEVFSRLPIARALQDFLYDIGRAGIVFRGFWLLAGQRLAPFDGMRRRRRFGLSR